MDRRNILVLVTNPAQDRDWPVLPNSEEQQRIVDLAFALWLDGGFRELSPDGALLKAYREIKGGLQPVSRNDRAGPLVASRF